MDSTVTAQEVMDREFVGVSESDTVHETAEMMVSADADTVLVMRGSDLVGLVTERDALAALVDGAGDEPVTEAMENSVPTASPNVTLAEAADEMSSMARQRIVISDGTEPVGILSEHDLITTSPFAPDREVTAEPETVVVGRPDDRAQSAETAGRGFEAQSICEACGALARDLATFNGQHLCADCRDI